MLVESGLGFESEENNEEDRYYWGAHLWGIIVPFCTVCQYVKHTSPLFPKEKIHQIFNSSYQTFIPLIAIFYEQITLVMASLFGMCKQQN